MKKTAVVIGAGWAGLSCAVELAQKGYQVSVLEQSNRIGGRASSFTHSSGNVLDNGQHLFMGCYEYTIQFLTKIGTIHKLYFQKNLSIDFINKQGKTASLKCWNLPAPLHLLSGLIFLKTLSGFDKLAFLKIIPAIKKQAESLKKITVEQWLKECGQSHQSIKNFWEPITLATLNESCSIAEADSLATVLKLAFLGNKKKSQMGIATEGLSDLCGPATEKFLRAKNSTIQTNQLVTQINIKDKQVQWISLRDGKNLSADLYVSALPFFILRKILETEQMNSPFFERINHLSSSPIFSITLWFDRPISDQLFTGMLDTRTQWMFNKNKIFIKEKSADYVSLVISGAHEYLNTSDNEIIQFCLEELKACFPKTRFAQLKKSLVLREKNATLSPKVGYSQFRLPQKTPISNLLLCGDWTETGLPATIESAVRSGVLAAQHAK